jgi:hypothetical protein
MKYLIDTDWVVLHLKGSQAVTQKLKELYPWLSKLIVSIQNGIKQTIE